MQYTIKIDDSSQKAKALLEFLQTLDFVSFENNELNSWQKTQLDKSILEHENGSTNYITWEQAKKDLFKKFNVK